MSLEARIPALRLNLGLKTRIWASRLEYELRRGWTEKERKEEKEEEKFPLCVNAKVISPFRAAAQKGKK